MPCKTIARPFRLPLTVLPCAHISGIRHSVRGGSAQIRNPYQSLGMDGKTFSNCPVAVNVLPVTTQDSTLVNATDNFKAQVRAKEAAAEGAFRPERRQRTRMSVHWPVRLLKEGAVSGIQTTTQNLSSSGFYCLSITPLPPGETLICALTVPAYDPRSQERTISLECRALVVRAEAAADGLFGIACRIEDYHLVGDARSGV